MRLGTFISSTITFNASFIFTEITIRADANWFLSHSCDAAPKVTQENILKYSKYFKSSQNIVTLHLALWIETHYLRVHIVQTLLYQCF